MPDEKADIGPTSDPKLIQQLRKMELDAEGRKQALEAETNKLRLEMGWIGSFVGSAKNAPNNIAFLILLVVVLAGFIVGFAYPHDRVEFWKLIAPIITLVLGYIFGQKTSER